MGDQTDGTTFDVTQFPTVTDVVANKIKIAAGISPVVAISAAAEAAAIAPTLATKPGKERWPVKTGTDPDVGDVGKNVVNGENLGAGFVETTIEELVRIPRPADMQPPTQDFQAYQEHRSEPVETTIWRLEADIIELKMEADGDYHLVLQGDSGETMIGEVPTPRPPFVAAASPFLDNIKSARQEVEGELVKPLQDVPFVPVGRMMLPRSAVMQSADSVTTTTLAAGVAATPAAFKTKIKNKRARITGVGFFDRVHNQDGVSQNNGIELHPVLEIEWLPVG